MNKLAAYQGYMDKQANTSFLAKIMRGKEILKKTKRLRNLKKVAPNLAGGAAEDLSYIKNVPMPGVMDRIVDRLGRSAKGVIDPVADTLIPDRLVKALMKTSGTNPETWDATGPGGAPKSELAPAKPTPTPTPALPPEPTIAPQFSPPEPKLPPTATIDQSIAAARKKPLHPIVR